MLLFLFVQMGLKIEEIRAKSLWLVLIAISGVLPSIFKKIGIKCKPFIPIVFSLFQISLVELLNPCQFAPIGMVYIILTVLFINGINIIIISIVNNIFISSLISNIIILIWALVNHYYYIYRGDPFEISEIKLIRTAATVVGEYEFFIDFFVSLSVFACIFFCISIYNFSKRREKTKFLVRFVKIIVGCIFVSTIFVYPSPILNMWDKTESVKNYGYIYSSVIYANATFNVEKPDGYEEEDVQDVLNSYDTDKNTRKPNILCVMNEAFSDLPNTYGFETDVDLLPQYYSLKENTQKGWLYVSTFGGGTCNTEFEFLTGNSMAFMPAASVPYVQYVKEQQQSIAMYLKNLGYSTVAYHPYYKKGYNRDMIYPLMGFDEFHSIESDFESKAHIRWCLSDWSNYQNLFKIYEQKNKPIFLFNVTMQNHGGYIAQTDNVPVKVRAESIGDDNLNEYLSLVNTSDSAIMNLINYFSLVDEDTIILFFGDHQPSLKKETYLKFDEDFLKKTESVEESQKQSKVPFFIWANFDIEEKDDLHISANYLSVLLFENAGIPLTRYQQFLKELYREYPVINKYGYMVNSEFYAWSSKKENEQFDKYQNLIYSNMFDKSHIGIEEWIK